LLSFDNLSPTAQLKSIAKRDYWLYTAGNNPAAEARVYVSNPMVSYFTGVRQIMVAASILSEDKKKVLGMVSGSIEWSELERVINAIKATVLTNFGQEAKVFLVSRDGTYVYHHDPKKAIHLLSDENNRPILNKIGEKTTVTHRINDEKSPELVMAGAEMLAGRSGHIHLRNAKGAPEHHLFYAPVPAANYGLGVIVPMEVVLAPLYHFYTILSAISLLALGLLATISVLTARRATHPLKIISDKAEQLSAGDWNTRMEYREENELGIVSRSFNHMVDQLHARSKEISEAHERLLTILDGLEAMVYVADMETFEVLYTNREIREKLGDIIGTICWQTIQKGQSGPCPFCTNNRLVNAAGELQPPYAWDHFNEQLDRWFHCVDRAITWMDGRIVRMEIATDISARKQSEEQRTKLAAIIEHSTSLIAICSLTGEIQYLNRAGRYLIGLADSEKPEITLGQLLPDNGEVLFNQTILPTSLNSPGWEKETELVHRRENRMIPVTMNAFTLKQGDGRPVSLAIIAQDISERKRHEEQLRQAQKMEAIGTLAGGIAHDFNNLLCAIQGYGELSLAMTPPDGVNRSNLQEIITASRRAAELVKQILTFSRQMTPEKKPLSLHALAKESLKLLRATLPSTITIRSNIDNSCRPILADATQIHQVIMNLCTNASHAMQEKGGTLEMSLGEVQLDADLAASVELEPGPYAKLSVTDSGTGISPENLKRIFEPYFTTKELGRGTGLGLATVQGIVKSHRGSIRVQSTLGQGTTMEIYLPITIASEPEAEPLPQLPLPEQSGHAIVVDDENALMNLEKKILENLGWRVSSFASSTEALAAFEKNPSRFDLIITDQTMPELTGADLARKILAIRPEIPIILTTGYSESIDAKQAAELGIKAFLMKPFSGSELTKILQNLEE
jgi:PAS domain S-box-containing protein